MTIKEIIEKYGRTHKDNVVYLGYENGWGEKTYDLFKELEAFEVKGTYYRNGEASSQSLGFTASDGQETYVITWSLDSGD